ncbi:hypothetical protein [Streptomyces winkii]|uniref:hypothetical protein n=1 Tax=Streptomyces winkii TaxID=3051178 RepID=UPI0028D564E7|nr:hypothetical protein [Streptomyces sp. DSM 40971]
MQEVSRESEAAQEQVPPVQAREPEADHPREPVQELAREPEAAQEQGVSREPEPEAAQEPDQAELAQEPDQLELAQESDQDQEPEVEPPQE